MPELNTLICHCHNVTLGDLADYIKKNTISDYMQIVEDLNFECGDTCQKCWEDGYNNDGLSLALAVGMVNRGYI